MSKRAKARVLVLGGGFAGLEAALQLRTKLPERADITLISDKDYFLFKPNTIYVPFGFDLNKLKFRLARPLGRKNIHFIHSPVREVDPVARRVYVIGNEPVSGIAYDFLVVATGAGVRPEEIPGLQQYADTIWTPDQMLKLREALRKLVAMAKDGQGQDVLFLVPPDSSCSGPLYEMAMVLDTWLRRQSVRDKVVITWSTYEQSYIELYGRDLHEVVAGEFTRRGIIGHNGYIVDHIEDGKVAYRDGECLPFDLLISLPPYVASTHLAYLPAGDCGFIPTDPETLQVAGYPEVYAVGDTTDFPVKRVRSALLQADEAACHLSGQVLGRQAPLHANLLYLPMIAQLDGTTFSPVASRLAGSEQSAREAGDNAPEVYRRGPASAHNWRLSKLALSAYLPWRFKYGNPFHTGAPWKGVEANLSSISELLAH